jgi:hypothetical protein
LRDLLFSEAIIAAFTPGLLLDKGGEKGVFRLLEVRRPSGGKSLLPLPGKTFRIPSMHARG